MIPPTLGPGALPGGISGLIIAKGKVQAFIATLVTMTALRGCHHGLYRMAAPFPPVW